MPLANSDSANLNNETHINGLKASYVGFSIFTASCFKRTIPIPIPIAIPSVLMPVNFKYLISILEKQSCIHFISGNVTVRYRISP
ncbi:hypothetical protein VCRA2114E365_40117 [Vibrio crassostreae]|nr:hypothetical protein VCRA2113O351_30185 [Vibrio crassostreae]CAK2110803.1 hypothetical protein VCRA2113O357_40117 [Vibrio crassostreae]CAK2112103.1 hypothetical protein VCRA2117O376_40060 [Vibrio crassostreae]CAK2114109.1 hypothetical protein VCRA2113O363_40117 [Vibrio crassostreae]CAK2115673.1 hypothetical protein VCRA2113O362_40119 [Vibrio crassostreae]